MIKKLKITLSSLSIISVIALIPIVAVACSDTSSSNKTSNKTSTLQTAIALYIQNFNSSKKITGKSTVLPSNIPSLTTANISSYFDHFVPIPAGSTATFDVTNISDTDGTLSLKVILTGPDAKKEHSNAIKISGFLTTQNAINTYINAFNSSKNIIGKKNVLPSNIPSLTATNISSYFDNFVPIPNGITATFDVTNISDTDGTLSLKVILTGPDAKIEASNPIKISGFLTTNQKAINDYIVMFNSYINQSNSNKKFIGKSTISPSTLTSLTATNISSYFDNFALIPNGITATFTLVGYSNTNGTVNLSVTLTGPHAKAVTSYAITISGFLKN